VSGDRLSGPAASVQQVRASKRVSGRDRRLGRRVTKSGHEPTRRFGQRQRRPGAGLQTLRQSFGKPEPGEIAPPLPPPLLPGRIVLLPGRGEVFVRDTGPRPGVPTVLLLHGWTASADLNFFLCYAELAQRYRVLAIDHRGHGRGMRSLERFTLEDCADDAAALLHELGTGPAIALGYSLGGPVSMLLAHRHPEVVAGLVQQATALEWRASRYERVVWKWLTLMEAGLRLGTGEGFVDRAMAQAVRQQPEIARWRPWLDAEFRRGLTRQLVDSGRALSEYDARPWVSQLSMPAVVCLTTRDKLVRPTKQRQLAEALGAEVIEMTGDHDICLIHGEQYSAATRAAVDNVAQRAGLITPARVSGLGSAS